MKIGLDTPPVATRSRVLSREHLDSLTRTCDAASTPMWIEDLSGASVYRNRGARELDPDDTLASRYEIVDHAGHIVARLATAIG